MKKVAIFPGSFDPFTIGHADIALRGCQLFDEVIISVGHNSKKQRYFPIEFTLAKIREVFADNPKISVITYDELTANLAKRYDARFILRGLRNTTDFEYENSIAQANRQIYGDLETVFLITSPAYAHISSTIIREIHRYGHRMDEFLPYSLEGLEQWPR